MSKENKALRVLGDSRRLTGPNLFWDRPSAIIDLACAGDPAPFITAWESAARELLAVTGHANEDLTHRIFHGGASVLISSPIDALYAMCELNEAAFHSAVAQLGGPPASDKSTTVARLQTRFAAEANPPLLALQAAARVRGAPLLWDDQVVSIGHGASAQVWPARQLPDLDSIDWNMPKAIPVALVTGTNGKSTTVRMAAAMVRAAGLRAGLTSTDWIRVGEQILERGDYSGTGGARTLLRHPQVEVAVLETARGGLLRRGLAVESAAAALITNVAEDHLGDYGICTMADLIEAKFIVRRALHGDAPLILNADDPGIVGFVHEGRLEPGTRGLFSGKMNPGPRFSLAWFTLDENNPVVVAHRAAGGRAALLREGWLELADGDDARRIVPVADIPTALGGVARHNLHNALGAMLLCQALGIADPHLAAGLRTFRGDAEDNPGRSNWFEAGGVRILVDFAHNAHGMRALAGMVVQIPAQRRVLLMSQAGDRTNPEVRELVRTALSMHPDRLLTCDLPGYERGRAPGEVPALIRGYAMEAGMAAPSIRVCTDPVTAVRQALAEARPGDLLVLLALSQREEALRLIRQFIAEQAQEASA